MRDLFGGDAPGTDEMDRVLEGRGTRGGLSGETADFVIYGMRRATARAVELDLGPRSEGAENWVWIANERAEYRRERSTGKWLVTLETWKAKEVGLL